MRYTNPRLYFTLQTWQAHIAHCITTTRVQTVKVQGHRRLKLDLEAWQRHRSRSQWIE